MKLLRMATAGTDDAGDLSVVAEPADSGIEIQIDSIVLRQFGRAIECSAREVLEELGVTDCRLTIQDKGALDYVIRARIETALRRAAKEV